MSYRAILVLFFLLLASPLSSETWKNIFIDPETGNRLEAIDNILYWNQNMLKPVPLDAHTVVVLASPYGCEAGWQGGSLVTEVNKWVAAGINSDHIFCLSMVTPPLTPTGISFFASVGIPTLSGTRNETVSPSAISIAMAVGIPFIDSGTGSITLNPTTIPIIITTGTPTISWYKNETITPGGIAFIAATGTPTVSGQRNESITPSGIATVSVIGTPTVSGGSGGCSCADHCTTPAEWTTAGNYTWCPPNGVTSVTVKVWGGGGKGGTSTGSGGNGSGGGGGGAYATTTGVSVTNSGSAYDVVVALTASSASCTYGKIVSGGNGCASYFGSDTVLADGGGTPSAGVGTGASGGLASKSIGATKTNGGSGSNNSGCNGGTGGTAASGGTGGTGGTGDCEYACDGGNPGNAPGGGGGGAGEDLSSGCSGGAGAAGKVRIEW